MEKLIDIGAEKFVDTVLQHTSSFGIYREQASAEIVGKDQAKAILDHVFVEIFAFPQRAEVIFRGEEWARGMLLVVEHSLLRVVSGGGPETCDKPRKQRSLHAPVFLTLWHRPELMHSR